MCLPQQVRSRQFELEIVGARSLNTDTTIHTHRHNHTEFTSTYCISVDEYDISTEHIIYNTRGRMSYGIVRQFMRVSGALKLRETCKRRAHARTAARLIIMGCVAGGLRAPRRTKNGQKIIYKWNWRHCAQRRMHMHAMEMCMHDFMHVFMYATREPRMRGFVFD